MKIYTFPRSRSLRVLWTLEELGVDYETVKVDMFSDKPKAKSPHSRGKVPFMVDGDVSIEETFAICHYLCHKFPNEKFYPSDIKEQSVVESYISFALTDLESPIWSLLKQLIFVPEEKRILPLVDYFKVESENVLHNKIRTLFLRNFVHTQLAIDHHLQYEAFLSCNNAYKW